MLVEKLEGDIYQIKKEIPPPTYQLVSKNGHTVVQLVKRDNSGEKTANNNSNDNSNDSNDNSSNNQGNSESKIENIVFSDIDVSKYCIYCARYLTCDFEYLNLKPQSKCPFYYCFSQSAGSSWIKKYKPCRNIVVKCAFCNVLVALFLLKYHIEKHHKDKEYIEYKFLLPEPDELKAIFEFNMDKVLKTKQEWVKTAAFKGNNLTFLFDQDESDIKLNEKGKGKEKEKEKQKETDKGMLKFNAIAAKYGGMIVKENESEKNNNKNKEKSEMVTKTVRRRSPRIRNAKLKAKSCGQVRSVAEAGCNEDEFVASMIPSKKKQKT